MNQIPHTQSHQPKLQPPTHDRLVQALSEPAVLQQLLGSYDKHYSLGAESLSSGAIRLILRVEPVNVSDFPTSVKVDGHDVDVLVKGGFRRVIPLKGEIAGQSMPDSFREQPGVG